MQGKLAYGLEHMDYGIESQLTGWYVVRYIIVNDSIIDRRSVMRFSGDHGDVTGDMLSFEDYIKAGHRVLPRNAKIEDLLKA